MSTKEIFARAIRRRVGVRRSRTAAPVGCIRRLSSTPSRASVSPQLPIFSTGRVLLPPSFARDNNCHVNGQYPMHPSCNTARHSSTSPTANNNKKKPKKKIARLRIHGPDAPGLIAAYTSLLYETNCNILDCASEQSIDDDEGGKLFFQRIVFDYGRSERCQIEEEIRKAGDALGMRSALTWVDDGDGDNLTPCSTSQSGGAASNYSAVHKRRNRVAIFVSKFDHCLWELLLRHQAGELECDIPVIISNHPDLRHVAETFDIPYHVFPINKENKQEQETEEERLLKDEYGIDLIVLARYMQIFTDSFVNRWSDRIINIHHSFLPAFQGGRPYHAAHERGVKLIGATAHIATPDLDEGPIIEQGIARVSHRDTVNDLIRKGRTLEKTVLLDAVKACLDDRIIVWKNKCIVFGD